MEEMILEAIILNALIFAEIITNNWSECINIVNILNDISNDNS